MSFKNVLKDYKIFVPANSILPFAVSGNYLKYRDGDISLKITTDEGSEFLMSKNQAVSLADFEKIYFENNSGNSVLCTFAIGYGSVEDLAVASEVGITNQLTNDINLVEGFVLGGASLGVETGKYMVNYVTNNTGQNIFITGCTLNTSVSSGAGCYLGIIPDDYFSFLKTSDFSTYPDIFAGKSNDSTSVYINNPEYILTSSWLPNTNVPLVYQFAPLPIPNGKSFVMLAQNTNTIMRGTATGFFFK